MLVGTELGTADGEDRGAEDGTFVGTPDGTELGTELGTVLGTEDGLSVLSMIYRLVSLLFIKFKYRIFNGFFHL